MKLLKNQQSKILFLFKPTFHLIFIHRKASVNDISIQCNEINDSINRSTQTIDQTTNPDLIKDYSLRTVCYQISTTKKTKRNIFRSN